MADPDPNPSVNLAGSGVVLHVQRPDGELIPVQGTDAGELPVAATGAGGESLATEPTADRTADATEALAATIAPGGVPSPGQQALAIVNVDPAPTFAAAPSEGTELTGVYIAGSAPFMLDRFSNPRATIIEVNSGDIATGVGTISGQLPEELALSGGLKTEIVAPLPSGTNAIGTVEVTASTLPTGAATETTLATRASETTAAAIAASLVSIDTKIPASPSEEHVTAASPHAVNLSNGSSFYVAAQAGDNLGADLRVAGAAVANGNPVPVSDAGGSLTVDGTVTANVGTTGGLALDATLTGGTQKAIARGGAKGATVAADVTSTAEGADHQALDVQIYNGGTAINPTQIRALTAADVVTADLRVLSAAVTISNPAATRRIPGTGRPVYRVSVPAIALSGTNKSLLAMQNASGTGVRILGIRLQNAQFTNISGAIQPFYVRRTNSTVTGGSAAGPSVSPASPFYGALNVGVTWITGGTLGGSPETVVFTRLSTDDVAVSATDTTVGQFVRSIADWTFPFFDDPVEVPNGYSADVQILATVAAGQFDIHWLIEGVYP